MLSYEMQLTLSATGLFHLISILVMWWCWWWGVEVGMPLCGVPVFGDKHCCGGNVWKGHSPVSEWGRLCFLCASSREAVIHRPNTAKQRPKHNPALPFKMILVIFKHDLLYLWSSIELLVAVSKQNICQSVQQHCRDP